MKPAHRYRVRRALGGALLVGSLAAPASAQQSGCESYVAPFFRGTGGFVAKPSDGRSVGLTVRRGSSSRVETLFARSDGLVVQLLSSSTNASLCSDDSGAPVECRISFSGIEDGGWYWVNGDRNAAVAPLICEDELGGAEALDPGGVSITRSEHGTATLFVHDAQKLMGIIPHLAPAAGGLNSCQERVAPIFRGEGGYVLKPASGESPVLTIEEEPGGRTESRNLDVRPEDGLAVGLLSSPLCPGAVDQPVVCRVSFSGVEDGGWYWVNGDRNAAVAPLVCAEQLGGASALDPGGVAVTASTRGTGTLVVHETQNLMAIVPHLARVPEAADLVVESATVSERSPSSGEDFTLSAEVVNRGETQAAATTLRFYRSSDATISSSDTEVGMVEVAALDAASKVAVSVSLRAPAGGNHWYGGCVDEISGEADSNNNCSNAAVVQVNKLGPEMVTVKSGSFMMGCDLSANCPSDELPIHRVTIDYSFELSKYEVTFEEWDACVADGGCGGYSPDDEGWGRGRRPVINVGWTDAQLYVDWLSAKTGVEYRLPSEAEWEYAARAGAQTAYSWGDEVGTNRANCIGCGSEWDNVSTAPVGSFSSNAWGLHDMHGNVIEWVQDCWHTNYDSAPTDGSAWQEDPCPRAAGSPQTPRPGRVVRGSAWRYNTSSARSAARAGWEVSGPPNRQDSAGFRVARTVSE